MQSQNKYIGDDCAYIKDLGIVVTQDNFIETIEFDYLEIHVIEEDDFYYKTVNCNIFCQDVV